MESSGYFVYDEQYVHIEGIEKYRALLKDTVTGNFVEDIVGRVDLWRFAHSIVGR